MNSRPLVTVLMPIYNDRQWAVGAADSVLQQTMCDFEFLIVDDGSTDGSGDVMRRLGDSRIKVMTLECNRGITAALNAGLDVAKGKYIARMDADDVCEPERLALQMERMEADASLVIIGSARRLVNESGVTVAISTPALDDLSIRWKLLLGNPLAHPTVMMRRETLERHQLRYEPTFIAAEDYELWTRLLCVGTAANLPEPLVQYRLRDGISRSRCHEQLESHDRIALLANSRFLPNFPMSGRQVRELRGRYGGHSVREPEMDPFHPNGIKLYEAMLRAFIEMQTSNNVTPMSPPQLDDFARRELSLIAALRTSAA